jgi:hypothetical protein
MQVARHLFAGDSRQETNFWERVYRRTPFPL